MHPCSVYHHLRVKNAPEGIFVSAPKLQKCRKKGKMYHGGTDALGSALLGRMSPAIPKKQCIVRTQNVGPFSDACQHRMAIVHN